MADDGDRPSFYAMLVAGSPSRGLVGIGRGRGDTAPSAMDGAFQRGQYSEHRYSQTTFLTFAVFFSRAQHGPRQPIRISNSLGCRPRSDSQVGSDDGHHARPASRFRIGCAGNPPPLVHRMRHSRCQRDDRGKQESDRGPQSRYSDSAWRCESPRALA